MSAFHDEQATSIQEDMVIASRNISTKIQELINAVVDMEMVLKNAKEHIAMLETSLERAGARERGQEP